jgi:hypothetical protein
VPHSDVQIPMPKIGDVVSFSSDTTARAEMPVNPKIYRVRTDISWEEVLANHVKEQQFLNSTYGGGGKENSGG